MILAQQQKMKTLRILIFTLLVMTTASCGDDGEPCGATSSNRTGAICNDGSRSTATGSGACSHHGGVDFWVCSK